jgi:membrane-bound lytic murein transglycosylase D
LPCFWPRGGVRRYPRQMLKRCLLAAVLVGWGSPARADPAASEGMEHPVAAPVPGETDVDVDEVLKSARRELVTLLAKQSVKGEDESRISPPDAPISVGTPPPSMTSLIPKRPLVATGSVPELTWLRGLAMPDIPIRWDDRLVHELEYFRTHPRGRALVRGLFQRQAAYGTMIRAKLRAAQLPEDLIYVAMAESGFDPKARSEVGALGIWQLMPAPASQYGLEMTSWIDARMSPEPCTDAAMRYFHDVYADLGSWPLSLAAYNMGYGALLRSIQKYNTNDFWLLASLEAGLPFETVSYITRIMAYAIVGRNRARFGLADIPLDTPSDTVTIDLPGGLTFAKIAKNSGLDVATLTALNPELKKPRLPPDVKTWPLRVPKDRAARFHEKWAGQLQLLPPHRQHVLRLGERLSDVAEMYATTTAKLLKLNDWPDGSAPRPGTKLLVPDVEPIVIAKAMPDRPPVGVPPDSFVYVDRRRVFYRVAQGDELSEIAQFFRVSVDELKVWNRIATDAKLQRGMYLQLYVPPEAELNQTLVLAPNQVRTLVVGSEEFFNFHESQQKRVRKRYRVKPGDTLRTLAEKFDLSIGSLARINQFGREKKLEPDSEIIVYVAEPTPASPQSNAKRTAPN